VQCEIAEVAICFQAGKGFDGEQSQRGEKQHPYGLLHGQYINKMWLSHALSCAQEEAM
jgi:hypothetical protein